MAGTETSILTPGAVLVIVVSALFGAHAMDIGQLIVALYDAARSDGADSRAKFRVEGGLAVAGAGFVILIAMSASAAARTGTAKHYETLLVALVTGFLGLTFSILEKTADASGLPTKATARGLLYVGIGACVFLPPFLAMPWTSEGLSRAVRVLRQLAIASLVALFLGFLVQGVYVAIASACEGPCANLLEQGYLAIGTTSFFISAPWVASFIAGMAVLICDPFVHRSRWPQFSRVGRGIWLLTFVGVSALLSVLYSLGYYYPSHGSAPTGWLQHSAADTIDRAGTVWMLLALNLPGLIAAIGGLLLVPVGRGRPMVRAWDLPRAILALLMGGGGAWLVVQQLAPLAVLAGKEVYFIAAHAATALVVTVSAVLVCRMCGRADTTAAS